jgi:exonuclease SbcC
VKPISLQLCNFGPYAGAPITIAFDTLDRLFLIAGDTGAGKTSLFDALCFALYGRPLGTREAKGLRSQFAPEDESTYVELVFECRGERWKVRRSPYLARPKKRGGGFVIDEATELHRLTADATGAPGVSGVSGAPSWVPLNLKPKDVDDRIAREILRLSHEEFSKILVLPQGEFQRFLEMQTAERAEILEKLFPTELHQRLASEAKQRAIQVGRERQELESRLQEVRRDYDPDAHAVEQARLVGSLEALRATERSSQEALAGAAAALQAGRALADAFLGLAEADKSVTALEGDATSVAGLEAELGASRRAHGLVPLLDNRAVLDRTVATKRSARDDLRTTIGRLEAERDAHAQAVAALSAQQANVEALQAEETRAGDRLQDLESLRGVRDERTQAAAARAKHESARPALVDAEALAAKTLAELDAIEQERELVRAERDRVEADEKRFEGQRADAETAFRWSRDVARETEALERQAARVKELAAIEAEAEAEVRRARERLEAQTAGMLAAVLREGEPCPVCGSDAHPHPAAPVPEREDGRAAVRAAEVARDARRAEHQRDAAELERLRATLRLRESQAGEALARILEGGYASLDAWIAARKRSTERRAEVDLHEKGLGAKLATREARKRALDAARATRERCDEALATAKLAEGACVARLADLERRTGEVVDIVAALAQARAASVARRGAIDVERAAIKRTLDTSARLDRELHGAQVGLVSLDADLVALDAQARALDGVLREAFEAAGFSDAVETRAAVRTPVEQAALQQRIEAWRDALQIARGRLDQLRTSTAGREVPDLDRLVREEQERREASTAAASARAEAESALALLQERAARWRELLDQVERLQRDSAAFVELSRDLNGENGRKLDFSTFILTYWLEQVLERATRRFRRLSDDRYWFVLNTTQTDARRRYGLEIDVGDSHTQLRRSVRSLSGGEKFMASLSLALGLSDVIQERAGGIELDTLFIDEGFGSLDADALERALSVLDEIGAHRTVGVISHVETLKKSIPCQLRVEKGPSGSRVVRVG